MKIEPVSDKKLSDETKKFIQTNDLFERNKFNNQEVYINLKIKKWNVLKKKTKKRKC